MNSLKRFVGACLFSILAVPVSFAQVRLPQLVNNGMILQRDAKINIWGWASPGEKLVVKFNSKTYRVTANADSTWRIILPPFKSRRPLYHGY